jgi:small subunit ribosomal protein S17
MVYEKRKTRMGRVISDKMSKTVIVAVEWKQLHSKYGKPVRRTTKLVAHDSAEDCRTGDVVKIIETRPLSKTKRWRVLEIISHKEMPGTVTTEAVSGAVDEKPILGEKPEIAGTSSEENPGSLEEETTGIEPPDEDSGEESQ